MPSARAILRKRHGRTPPVSRSPGRGRRIRSADAPRSSLREVSAWVAVPFVWFAVASSRGLGRWTHLGSPLTDFNYQEGSPLDRRLYLVLIILGLICLSKREQKCREILRNNGWIVVLLCFMGLSVLWSEFPGVAVKRWVKLVGSVLMALIVLTESNPVKATTTVLRTTYVIALPLSVFLVKYVRSLGVAWDYQGGEMWIGVTPHKNNLGQIAMMGILFSVWSIRRNWRQRIVYLDIFVILCGLYLLKGTPGARTSTTSMIVGAFGVAVYIWLQLARRKPAVIRRRVAAFTFVVAVLVTSVSFFGSSLTAYIGELTGRDATFTGRTPLWADMLEIARDQPILGVGYGSFWIGSLGNNLWEKHIWRPQQGHNGYIDVYVEAGIIGLLILVMFLLTSLKKVVRKIPYQFDHASFRLAALAMFIIHNITESSYQRSTHNLWIVLLLVAIDVPMARSRPERSPAPRAVREARRLSPEPAGRRALGGR